MPNRIRINQPPPARRQDQDGVSLVEFALVAPIALTLILGLFVIGTVVMNQVQLANAVRDGARAAAVCGGVTRYQMNPMPTLPDGATPCTGSNLVSYINQRLQAVPGGATLSVAVQYGAAIPNDPNVLDECQKGKTVIVTATYPQPLYLPFIGVLVGDNGSSTRTLRAEAEATCEV